MIKVDTRALIKKLNRTCTTALEAAAGQCLRDRCSEVLVEHFLLKLGDVPGSDVERICRRYGVDDPGLRRTLSEALAPRRRGDADRPVWSPRLVEWMQAACLLATAEFGAARIRSGHLLLALLATLDHRADDALEAFRVIPPDDLRRHFRVVVEDSVETPADTATAQTGAETGEEALARFTVDLTKLAREGSIDDVLGRDREIRQMADILARRRKNNPLIVGEAGVGKTALVEGLALRIARGEAASFLSGVRIVALDLGLLQAGAGVRGEFEQRLTQVIDEVKSSSAPVILFIDEAHTLIGAGNAAGGGDAANLLKPALARGELRTIAATTWSEYKRHFEKDAALSRRFNLVKVGEPDEAATTVMLRGLARTYEREHELRIFDEAIVSCVRLGNRYVTGRHQPDKGIDLLDTTAARVKLGHTSKPLVIDELRARVQTLEAERDALGHDVAHGARADDARRIELEDMIEAARLRLSAATERWQREHTLVSGIVSLRARIDEASEAPPDERDCGAAALDALRREHDEALRQLAEIQGDDPLVRIDVTPDAVAEVVADWTGVPVGKLLQDEARAILNIEARLGERLRGQDHAIRRLAEAIRAARVGVRAQGGPIGVFLCVGPSGVGKTECALGLADLLFGGERCLTTVNMSEFQERHTVSRLIGSPPGYVGYGEGGVLTEAVRKQPYSVVLLDEVEKADREVMNLFYQVFDKGVLADGEGREVDFSNTIVYLTSNLGDDAIQELCAGDRRPSPDELLAAVRPTLVRHFQPALLARMTVVPFYSLDDATLRAIAEMKLDALAQRVTAEHRIALSWEPAVADRLTARCTDGDTGARNLDHVIRGSLLPELSRHLLGLVGAADAPAALHLTVSSDGAFEVRSTGTPAGATDRTAPAAVA